MLTKTLQDGLKQYGVGEKIRALRLKRKMALTELGQHTGLSPALLSKIERGRLFPTLPTLLRIAFVFSVGLDFFFVGARDEPLRAVVRKADRLRFPAPDATGDPAYRFESLDYPATQRRFSSYLAEFLPVSIHAVQPHEHAGVEFLYVLEGTLHVQFGEEEQALEEGDSMYFDASAQHSYRSGGKRRCRAIVVTAP